ncbi:benzoate/H(+) symporter BenE family transporter [Pikeienuella piscinae]|uniref:Benzoate/H(+) symporter BenE family transporter n=1 Tax=Pikeienuella piscinae TaxID=2748098 RepID=A0A7L5BZE6_9RHOB|nr:benzoate/H(+) symporter BenE family transporter [Pikeienuella piscinae]QIE56208.1 benzoate/H(+) symporter BenE family transporter [Pikeienuella piscinae]
MFRDLSASSVFMGLLAAFVGFASSFAVVLQGLRAAGATEAEAASGLMAIAIAKGIAAIALSGKTRIPIAIAWSTPGAALLATSGALPGGFAEAVGAFLVSGLLLAATGLFRPLARVIERIPASLASALLAGVLLTLCLAPFRAIAFNPLWGLVILIGWVVGGRIGRVWSAPGALAGFILVVIFGVRPEMSAFAALTTAAIQPPIFVQPIFTVAGLVGIALPLYVVTMAGQNLPGAGVLKAHGYPTHAGLVLSVSGFASMLAAPFGGHACNYAAITAAMCMGEEAHPDPARRYWASITAGGCYVLLGVFAGLTAGFVALAPTVLIESVAGLALLGAFAAAAYAAFARVEDREASAVTLLATASGLSMFGVSGAFWGLLGGGAIHWLRKTK